MKVLQQLGEDAHGYSFYCPGCKENHFIRLKPTKEDPRPEPLWNVDSNLEKPTVTPSLKITVTRANPSLSTCCHVVITNGELQFCEDCTHELAGKKVPMEEIE